MKSSRIYPTRVVSIYGDAEGETIPVRPETVKEHAAPGSVDVEEMLPKAIGCSTGTRFEVEMAFNICESRYCHRDGNNHDDCQTQNSDFGSGKHRVDLLSASAEMIKRAM